eukprot:3941818-Rhodomonas_salina.2
MARCPPRPTHRSSASCHSSRSSNSSNTLPAYDGDATTTTGITESVGSEMLVLGVVDMAMSPLEG